VTAIRAGGDNPDLVGDSDWTPLGTTPSHPEYPAAHGCVTGTVSSLIRDYFGSPKGTRRRRQPGLQRRRFTPHTFDDTRDLFEEVFWARIYAVSTITTRSKMMARWADGSAGNFSEKLPYARR